MEYTFASLEDLQWFWEGPHSGWKRALARVQLTLQERLKAPQETIEVPLDKVRYTHSLISLRYRHGEHKYLHIDEVRRQLLDGGVSPDDQAMVLDVVWHHRFYRSLNNRHLHALKEAQAALPADWLRRRIPCCVRVWPLTPSLKIHGRCITHNLYEASSTRDNARSVSPNHHRVR